MKNKYNNKTKWRISIVEILLGVSLSIAGYQGLIQDEFWTSFAYAMIIIGVINLLRCFRYEKDESYRENFDISATDERNRYLSTKAWAWSGYWVVMGGGVGTIVFKLLGKEELMMYCSYSACIMMLLYWINYLYLKKKY